MSKPGFIAAALLCGSLASPIHAQTTQRDVKFSKELNKLSLLDYSEYFIEQQMKKAPEDIDLLKIQLAETYIYSGKKDKAAKGTELIASVKESSPYYPFAQLSIGKIKVLKKEFADGIKYLKAFEDFCNKNHEDENFDKDAHKEGIGYLVFAYQNTKQLDLVKKTKDAYTAIVSPGGTTPPQQVKLEAALDTLAKAERANPGPERDKLLETSIKMLTEEVPFFGQNEITARSYYEAGRAYIAAKKYDKAIETMSQSAEFVATLNTAYAEINEAKRAPGGFIAYWKGVALQEKAKLAEPGEEQIKLYKDAFIQFFVNLKKYEDNKHASEAFDSYRKCLAFLEENNSAPKSMPPFKIPVVAKRTSILSPEETLMYQEKKFTEFIDSTQKSLYTKRTAPGAEDALMKLALSYMETDKKLEALAIADYLTLVYPKSKETQATLTTIAVKHWTAKATTPEEEKANKAVAVREYGKFLEVAPDHPKAPDVAMVVAQYYFQTAEGLAKKAKGISDNKEKRAVTDEALEAFKSAIPYYKYIADNFGMSERGVTALHFIALCNSYAREYEKAAASYLKYIPKIMKDKFKLANAKFSVGDSYFRAGQKYHKIYKALRDESKELKLVGSEEYIEKAELKLTEATQNRERAMKNFKSGIEQFNEYTDKWLNDPKYLGSVNDSKVAKTTEGVYELIGWSYDLLDERKVAADKFGDFIKRYPKSNKIPALMQRQGELFAELEDFDTAEKILDKLASKYPDTPQGKRALFTLARSQYNIKKFAKSITTFNKIIDKKLNISVSNLKWIVKNMVNTDDDNKADAGKLIVSAGQELEKRLENPVLEEWVGTEKAHALKSNPQEKKTTIDMLRERLYFNIGVSASEAGLSKEVFAYLEKVLANENTPFIFEAGIARADEYYKTKNYELARKDLVRVGTVAMTAQKAIISLQVNNRIGDTYLAEDNFKQAFSKYSMVAARPITLSDEMLSMMTDEQKQETEEARPLVEYATYKAAFCASKLGKEEDKAKLVAKYKESFSKGRFIKEMANLPASVVKAAPASVETK